VSIIMTLLSAEAKRYTLPDLLKMGADGARHELVEGMLVEQMPPGDEHGTRLVWVVYPQTRTAHIRTASTSVVLDTDGVLDGRAVLPAFSVPVREIFALLDR
jgi:hypothetical protein